jgi:hypothetical protein
VAGRRTARFPLDAESRFAELRGPAAVYRWLAFRESQEASNPHAILLVH